MKKTNRHMSLSTVCRKVSAVFPVSVCLLNRARLISACIIVLIAMTALAAPLRAAPVLVDQVGGFQSPARVALTSWGDIYVADHGRGVVVVIDQTGKRVGTIKGFKAPLGLAVFETADAKQKDKEKDKPKKDETPPHAVYVGDEGDGSVRIFVDGVEVGFLGNGSGEFGKPNGIAVTQTQKAYVVDSKAHEVKVYDGLGNFQFAFGAPGHGDGQFTFPTDIAIDETRGEVYVTDFAVIETKALAGRIAVFDLAGAWLRNIDPPPAPDLTEPYPIFFRLAGLGIDPAGNLYVVDNTLSSVTVIDGDGALIDVIGYQGGQYWTGELAVPVDAAADGARIYVTSSGEGLLVVFEVVP